MIRRKFGFSFSRRDTVLAEILGDELCYFLLLFVIGMRGGFLWRGLVLGVFLLPEGEGTNEGVLVVVFWFGEGRVE